jgi:O-antigen ligase
MRRWAVRPLRWRGRWALPACGATGAALGLAAFISHQAAESERLLVRAARVALSISAAGNWNHPRWDGAKAEMLRSVREGIAINPHYRKITPMVADELARWGDWKNATWIWESVLSSRPNVVAILTNVARGHTAMDQPEQANAFLERARAIQPGAPAVRSLQVIVAVRAGQEAQALQLAREALDDNAYDFDLLTTAFRLAWRAGDPALAVRAMATRQARFPEHRLDGHLQLAQFHASFGDEARAIAAYRAALAETAPARQAAVLAQVPPAWRDRVVAP